MPALMLVAVVKGRYFRDPPGATAFDSFLMSWLLTIPLLGEAATLTVAAGGRDTALLRGVVLSAALPVGGLLFLYATRGAATRTDEADRPRGTDV